ncbi:MAG: flagellar brake protein [Candidatus Nitricoxidivorans perseverans]|uniref:Flagellar brake protein YcgR n=1 Tax=Candidatus Nitricoxidivorans perseverans TaxID=2975601 RepID=A0AA49FM98_9PROT|nr:MAG: flagellar brake protein [Candidatus Nitricoxidivorans perseverans]
MTETQQTPGQRPDTLVAPEAFSQYLLHAQSEIVFILRALIASGDRVTVYFNEGKDFLLTALIAIDDDGIVLDYGSGAEMNRRALAAEKLFCITTHDKVRVQFQLRGVRQIEYEGRPAFRAKLPDTLLRLQRREYYRLTTPIARPLKCRITASDGDTGREPVEVSIIDISGGGLGVIAPPDGIPFEPEMDFHGCRIELPEVGIIVATLRVRNIFEVTLRNGSRVKRSGCQFIDLPGPMLTLVQRYIIKVERERKARESGMA